MGQTTINHPAVITILLGGIYKLTVPSHGWFLTILPTFYCFIALKIPGKYCLTIGSQCFTWIYQFLDSCNMSRSQSQLFTPGTKIIKIYVIAFWRGPITFHCFVQGNWLHGDLNCLGLRGAGCLCVCNHVGELSEHILRLFLEEIC